MAENKKYWVGIEDLHQTEEFQKASQNEFAPGAQSVDEFITETDLSKTSTNRRDFLKFLGFSVTAATVAACETPVIHSVPYLNKPEQITAGIPTYYASTFFDGFDFASIVVKTREGRPIFLKGNNKHGINQGALTARVNSSVLSLYDGKRLKGPKMVGDDATWPEMDSALKSELRGVSESGKSIVLLTGSIISPSTQKAIKEFKTAFGEEKVKVVTYDPVSRYGIRKANEMSFGKSSIPDYDFSKAKTIVSVDADFMDNWLLHNQYVPQYAKNRNPQGEWMNKHYQFESRLSLTGSNADVRVPIMPSQEGAVVLAIYNQVAKLAGSSSMSGSTDGLPEAGIANAAKDLYANRGKSLFICGSNDPNVQVVANAINTTLGNYGSTISTDVETFINQGNDEEVMQLVADMNSGSVGALLIHGDINPAYSLPNSAAFISGMSKVGVTLSFARLADETAVHCKYICPDNHYLESWNDFYPKTGHSALAQPTISRLYNTRQFQESLLTWAGNTTSYHDYIRSVWQDYSASIGDASILFDDFWFNAVRNGSVSVKVPSADWSMQVSSDVLSSASGKINGVSAGGSDTFEVVLYTKVGIGNGSHATNPWLQELPDPISKITWDNYIAMNPVDVEAFGFNMHIGEQLPASLAKITVNGMSETLPVVAQPGQKKGTVSIALGYGRGAGQEEIGRAAYRTKPSGGYEKNENDLKVVIGKNLYPFVAVANGVMSYKLTGANIEAAGMVYPMASTQTHHTLMGRDSIVRETTFSTFKSSPKEVYNPAHKLVVREEGIATLKDVDDVDIWEAHPVKGVGHRWGMSIDLSTCIGCSACVTACHSENNVPVVGKDEIRRARDMHWMRIDRYYSSDMTVEKGAELDEGIIDTYREMEVPEYENPTTVFMPMMCQHCNHAPCETVCPVAATTHSNEGLNQMTYNRCIGTRYCANNCPFKVRRFNWFNYKAYDKFADVNPAQDATARMVLNPDVTVRSRGVMEKCSMCVQRIQSGKLDAKMKGEPVQDGTIVTACAEACPTNAISFGDLNDTKSEISGDEGDNRTYHALAEIGVKPNVSYKVKVRNT
ncbi:TAT-variant-translocated molybdopterin oxidoreductase [Cryomorpha ignava]|uniref:TAT-variant-translocated molybdopterin oxidoreductase n=1 Tax=Cryomorpha ignava TaxID=101383 RepID=A0A7K3WJS7_9FLAO|nr:TAT-variant-translocated molybdopterin oxidoreductase [Cryomorpha ignava]NEN21900.1 TAT-variant-translocated molybdopterin oxidoreductase [Cryomorpha ignava]